MHELTVLQVWPEDMIISRTIYGMTIVRILENQPWFSLPNDLPFIDVYQSKKLV